MRNTIIFVFGLLCALWFAWIGMIWVYWAALFIAYPVGLIALGSWLLIRNENKKRTKLIPVVLLAGLTLSLSMLTYLLIFD
jgi:hypothetical protein